jgi:hypothetical protein
MSTLCLASSLLSTLACEQQGDRLLTTPPLLSRTRCSRDPSPSIHFSSTGRRCFSTAPTVVTTVSALLANIFHRVYYACYTLS